MRTLTIEVAVPISEADFTDTVIELAMAIGWKCIHFRHAWSNKGYRTPIQGNEGFPDLILVKDGELIVAELKSDKGKLTEFQKEWLSEFQLTCARVFVWKPKDWPEIEAILKGMTGPVA